MLFNGAIMLSNQIGQKSPRVLQDIVPFGSVAPLIITYIRKHTKQGNGYRWSHIILGRLVRLIGLVFYHCIVLPSPNFSKKKWCRSLGECHWAHHPKLQKLEFGNDIHGLGERQVWRRFNALFNLHALEFYLKPTTLWTTEIFQDHRWIK